MGYLSQLPDRDVLETAEWIESLESLIHVESPHRVAYVLRSLLESAKRQNIDIGNLFKTPYINTISPDQEPKFPGDLKIEERIRSINRWNAMAMVHRSNKKNEGLGGHISTYASSANLYEIGFNHFFQGFKANGGGDQIFFQGHSSPGIYARAFLEGRLNESDLDKFRREVGENGLSSYPHPWLMPKFWQFPTVSMGLGPIAAIYQARFNKYLHDRGIKDTSKQRIWAFIGDGETDEVETRGALHIASRENLNNLIFVINCNLQRLDGPVRGNGKIIQELEGSFSGAGFDVIKVIWGDEWNELLNKDIDGLLLNKMDMTPDGQFQKYSVEKGSYIRKDFFGQDSQLNDLVSHLSDEQLQHLHLGGHSPTKIYAAYHKAIQSTDKPVVILAKTVKGWRLGEGFAGANTTHQIKKLNEKQLKGFRDILELPISDKNMLDSSYYHPGKKSEEIEYLLDCRERLGGFVPFRQSPKISLELPNKAFYKPFTDISPSTKISTTISFVRILRGLLRDKKIGKYIVPIIPDEGRTFGMDSLFKEIGIYSPKGQLYTPVDSKMLLHYRESKEGQLLEEGITEAGSMATFTAAGTSYSTHGILTIPFYIFYSMFGMQRTGDQSWAFGDSRGRGFLLGATAGRTTLNGEGLQHQDGHSHLLAQSIPNMIAYDPAYSYELAIIISDGLRRMIEENEDICYYITLYNENYSMPSLPKGSYEGILKGMYKISSSPKQKKAQAQLWGSGPILRYVLEAQKILADSYKVFTHVWSITSYQQLYRDAQSTERANRFNPHQKEKISYLAQSLKNNPGPIIATSDFITEIPSLLGKFIDRKLITLGTNGFGRSDTRESLRHHFEIDTKSIVYTTLHTLFLEGQVSKKVLLKSMDELNIETHKKDPVLL